MDLSRRRFLKITGAAIAGTVIASHALGEPEVKIRLAPPHFKKAVGSYPARVSGELLQKLYDLYLSYDLDINDAITRQELMYRAVALCTEYKNERRIWDFQVVCSELNNPPYVVDDHNLVMDVYFRQNHNPNSDVHGHFTLGAYCVESAAIPY